MDRLLIKDVFYDSKGRLGPLYASILSRHPCFFPQRLASALKLVWSRFGRTRWYKCTLAPLGSPKESFTWSTEPGNHYVTSYRTHTRFFFLALSTKPATPSVESRGTDRI